MGLLDRIRRAKTQYEMPEVEEITLPPNPTVVVAASKQWAKAWVRTNKPQSWTYAANTADLIGVRDSDIVFVGAWGSLAEAPSMWEYANGGGNRVWEDPLL